MSIITDNALEAPASRDSLGDRMKSYEMEARTVLPARAWTIIRVDGRAFHTWTKGLDRPYSLQMVEAMGETMKGMCEQIPGVVCAIAQSDEISLVIQDFSRPETQPWYGGQVQKMVSVAASMATALFGRHFLDRAPALFDARVFTVPNRVEIANCLFWRQIDGERNGISLISSNFFSSKQLHGVSTEGRKQMLEDAGVDLSAYDARFLHGQFAMQVEQERASYLDKRSGETLMLPEPIMCKVWKVSAAPDLNAQPDGLLLSELLPADPA